MSSLLMTTSLDGLTLISRGKVRDIYATSREDALLFIATDRISAFDVILNNVFRPAIRLGHSTDE
jgi:phosphoribosylaminoimidazole-succinocarboxamide synthase